MRLLLTPARWVYRGLIWLANSPRTLILAYLILIATCSVLYHFIEKVTYGDALWWAVVTASTVGYGDLSPKSGSGRMMAALLISIMVLIVVPLITAHFASKLIVDQDAFRHEEQEEIKANLRAIRAAVERMEAIERGRSDRPVAPSG